MQRSTESRRLKLALAITFVYFVAEVLGGILTNSLALLSDAVHMFSDIADMSLCLFAFQMARRPATIEKTYGYHRLEILVALLNGLALWLIVWFVFWITMTLLGFVVMRVSGTRLADLRRQASEPAP